MKIEAQGFISLGKVLDTIQNLEELVLSLDNTNIDNLSLLAITKSFKINKKLKKIGLFLSSNKKISAEGFLSLGKALNQLTDIEELYLGFQSSNMGKLETLKIIKAIFKLKKLKNLDICIDHLFNDN